LKTTPELKKKRAKDRQLSDYNSLLNLDPSVPDFSNLSPSLQILRADIDKLLPEQMAYFLLLIAQLRVFVRDFVGGAENFYGTTKYGWNSKVWLRVMISLSKFKVGCSSNDCCESFLPCTGKSGYKHPVITVLGSHFNAARLVCTLFEGPLAPNGNDASHCCHNDHCVFYRHLIFETKQINELRNCCKNGMYALCGCPKKKCIWVRDGKFLECRNNPDKADTDCKCGVKEGTSCFDPLNLITGTADEVHADAEDEQNLDVKLVDEDSEINEEFEYINNEESSDDESSEDEDMPLDE